MSIEDPKTGTFTLPDGTEVVVDINETASKKSSPGTYSINGEEVVVESEPPTTVEEAHP